HVSKILNDLKLLKVESRVGQTLLEATSLALLYNVPQYVDDSIDVVIFNGGLIGALINTYYSHEGLDYNQCINVFNYATSFTKPDINIVISSEKLRDNQQKMLRGLLWEAKQHDAALVDSKFDDNKIIDIITNK